MTKKGFINITVIMLVVVLIGVGGYLVLQQKSTQQPQEYSTEIPQSQEIEKNTPEPVDNYQETTTNDIQQTPPKEQAEAVKPIPETPSDISFNVLYPPTPSSFGCNPYAETYMTQQGKVIQTYDQWKALYDELQKNCYTKTDAPQIIDFDKETMIAVFTGRSCVATKIDVKTISPKSSKIVVHGVVTVGGCALPSFSYPFTLVAVDKTNLPAEFTFESVKHPSEPF